MPKAKVLRGTTLGPADIHWGADRTRRRMRATRRGGNFTPLDISTLAAWYDFGDLSTLYKDAALTDPVTAANDVILGAKDKSGAGNHLTVAANGPTYQTAVQNGNSVARFDGTNDLLFRATLTQGALAFPLTTFFSARVIAITTSAMSDSGGALGRLHGVYIHSDAKWAMFAGTVVSTSVAADTNHHVFGTVAANASSLFYLDGGANIMTALDIGGTELIGFTLASNLPAGGSTYMQVDILQALIFTGNLSNSDKDKVGRYLAGDAATTWTTVT